MKLLLVLWKNSGDKWLSKKVYKCKLSGGSHFGIHIWQLSFVGQNPFSNLVEALMKVIHMKFGINQEIND